MNNSDDKSQQIAELEQIVKEAEARLNPARAISIRSLNYVSKYQPN